MVEDYLWSLVGKRGIIWGIKRSLVMIKVYMLRERVEIEMREVDGVDYISFCKNFGFIGILEEIYGNILRRGCYELFFI